MLKHSIYFLITFLILFSFSCKKDTLHWQNAVKLESHSQTDKLNKILFKDKNNGYAFGGNWYIDAVILNTKDGGETWQRNSYTNVGQLLMSGTVSPNGSIYCCGFEGKLMRNIDTSSNWNFYQLEHYWYRDLAFTNAGSAIIVGGISYYMGMIQHIDSVGNVIQTDTHGYQLNKVKMVTENEGYICGYGVVLKTIDGGKTWRILNINNDDFRAIEVHKNQLWVCGYAGSIYYSSDGGNNWSMYRNGNDLTIPHYRLMDIVFTDNGKGWAVGEDGLVIYTNDNGQHWAEYDQFTTNHLNSIALQPNGNLFVAGDNGALYKLMPL